MKHTEPKNLVGCCGLYCGLCSKFQSTAPSRCHGCKLGEQHSWCSIWKCCTQKHKFETCAECKDVFNCPIFIRRKVTEWTPAAHNLIQIRTDGINNWVANQVESQRLLESLLKQYNEGRSASFYCKVCARMPIDMIQKAIQDTNEAVISSKATNVDIKTMAKSLKTIIKTIATANNITLE